jgi:aspartate aminotransferase
MCGAELAEKLLLDAGVCVLAGTAFGGVGTDHIRISYANSRENLTLALNRIRGVVETSAVTKAMA